MAREQARRKNGFQTEVGTKEAESEKKKSLSEALGLRKDTDPQKPYLYPP